MRGLLYFLTENDLAERLRVAADLETGRLEQRRFPDEESYLRVDTDPAGRPAVVLAALDRPDAKVLPLLFLADLLRDLSAERVVLVAPYLAYMRQDRRFEPGEAVTSRSFARLISNAFDALVTVDPHLHRLSSLDEIYAIPTRVVHAAPLVSSWIREEVERPLLVGPDEESAQWVGEVARDAGAPSIVLEKVRRGDRDVEVSVPEVERWRDRTPVLVDDIISTGRTMATTVGHLLAAGMRAPVCVGVHAVFAPGAWEGLRDAGAARIVTCDTIPHPSNAIDVAGALAEAVRTELGRARREG